MKIDFFEEFPNDENLAKASLLNYPCVVFLAAKSLDEFFNLKEKLNRINPLVEAAYWPILENSYWISPFSETKDLENLYEDLEKHKLKDLKVLIDLEAPPRNTRSAWENILVFSKSKRLIESIFGDSEKLGIKIFAGEGPISPFISLPFGYSYSVRKYGHERINMYYSSMMQKRIAKFLHKAMIRRNKNIGVGVIAKGVKHEPLLSPKGLEEDLKYFKNKNITIFRLGGLNQEYMDAINKFIG
ncbi:MAG: hypothetical protein WC309_03825 [Candidatus Paceibacterota bacterium]|jgi:hypothetical protein|nr:hypothetical protein [Candidatus Pacearchaeota archaeon]